MATLYSDKLLRARQLLAGVISSRWKKIGGFNVPARLRFLKKMGPFFSIQSLLALFTITFVSWALVSIFYKGLSAGLYRPKPARFTAASALAVSAQRREPPDSYKIITDRNLFGSTGRAIGDTSTPGEMQTILAQLDLRGTVAGDEKFGFAVIEEKGKPRQSFYQVGQKVAGATLVKVLRNAVVLRAGEKEETLRVKEAPRGPITARADSPQVRPGPPGPPGGTITINKNELNSILRDMGTMLTQAQVRPFFTAGTPDGFIISRIQPGSIYQRIGIAEGDVIQGVNDRKMQSADDMVELYSLMRAGSDMSLKLRRRGKQEVLNYTFK